MNVSCSCLPPPALEQVPWFADAVPHPFAWDMMPESETYETLVDLGHQVGIVPAPGPVPAPSPPLQRGMDPDRLE